eukprot:1176694-Prorocentrum_minimum.AAC.2
MHIPLAGVGVAGGSSYVVSESSDSGSSDGYCYARSDRRGLTTCRGCTRCPPAATGRRAPRNPGSHLRTATTITMIANMLKWVHRFVEQPGSARDDASWCNQDRTGLVNMTR